MAKVQAKVYVEESIWNAANDVFEKQGMSNSVGLERVLKTLIESDDQTLLLMLRQAGVGTFRESLARSIVEKSSGPVLPGDPIPLHPHADSPKATPRHRSTPLKQNAAKTLPQTKPTT